MMSPLSQDRIATLCANEDNYRDYLVLNWTAFCGAWAEGSLVSTGAPVKQDGEQNVKLVKTLKWSRLQHIAGSPLSRTSTPPRTALMRISCGRCDREWLVPAPGQLKQQG